MAGSRPRSPAVRVRLFASVRGGPAPGSRCRWCGGLAGALARGGNGQLRRHGPVVGEERHHRDGRRLLGHAHASRLDHRRQERGRRRGRARGHDRAERRRRGPAAVRPSRRARDRAGAGVPGSAESAARARHRAGGRSCARPEPCSCFAAGVRARARLTACRARRCLCAAGHSGSRAGGLTLAGSAGGSTERVAACARGGGCGRGVCGRGPGSSRPAQGRRRAARSTRHGGAEHRGASRCPARHRGARDRRRWAFGPPRCACASPERDRRPQPPRRFRGQSRAAASRPSGSVPARYDYSSPPGRDAPSTARRRAPACPAGRGDPGRAGAAEAPHDSAREPRRLPPCAPARPRCAGPGREAAKGRTYHCSRCAST